MLRRSFLKDSQRQHLWQLIICTLCFYFIIWNIYSRTVFLWFNPFHATGLFRYPLKTSVFWCFQGVSKETSGMKWVNEESNFKQIYRNYSKIDQKFMKTICKVSVHFSMNIFRKLSVIRVSLWFIYKITENSCRSRLFV